MRVRPFTRYLKELLPEIQQLFQTLVSAVALLARTSTLQARAVRL